MDDLKQPEALRLADALDAGENFYAESSMWFDTKLADAAGEAAAELRRLETANAELLEALKTVMGDADHGQHMSWSERCRQARAAIAKHGETK